MLCSFYFWEKNVKEKLKVFPLRYYLVGRKNKSEKNTKKYFRL